jgi:hypothetical protein
VLTAPWRRASERIDAVAVAGVNELANRLTEGCPVKHSGQGPFAASSRRQGSAITAAAYGWARGIGA